MIDTLKLNERLWKLYTNKEEYNPMFLDRHQRFPYYLSKHKNVFEPEVSTFLINNGLKVEYPNDKKFAVCLTHDIDVVYYSISTICYEIIKALQKLKISKSLKNLKWLLSKVNKKWSPVWNFRQIMDVEKRYGAKSSFYFLALDKCNKDYSYRIEDLRNELKVIVDNGWEVGLHGSFEGYNNLNQIKKQKERLENVINRQVIGYRNHFLRFEVPTTWELLADAGFKYDATFGYSDCVGFRNGMCHPFKPFNLGKNKYIDILEMPLNIMDDTLFDKYMRLDVKNALEIIKRLIDTVEKYKGVLTILWHNTYMVDERLEVYEEILKYCHKRNAWMTSGEEIWRWWKKIDN